MLYVYLVDSFGRKTLAYPGTSAQQAGITVKRETSLLDPDTERYILVTKKELKNENNM